MPYSIDTVARMTGISAFTLRNWEKRYEFLRPSRLGNGFRAYDDAHIEMLRKVAALLRHGARIGDLAESIRRGKDLPEVVFPQLAPEVEQQAQQLYSALVDFDLPRAETLYRALESGFEPAQVLDQIHTPLLAQIGREWSSGQRSLAQEHFASAFIRLKLATYLAAPPPEAEESSRRVLCATTEGELHEGGLMLVAAHLKLKGWSTYYLGTDLPIEDLRVAAERINPSLVCLSFTDKHGIRAALEGLSRFSCPVCIGGFGALTFDAEESLPPHLHLFRSSGRNAAEVIESVVQNDWRRPDCRQE